MGQSARATLSFGIDLNGVENEWNFKDYWEHEELDEYGDLQDKSEILEDLIVEFGGWSEYRVSYEADKKAWGEQNSRRSALLEEIGFKIESYGAMEYLGYAIVLPNYGDSAWWGCKRLMLNGYPSSVNINKLKSFVDFLDSKNLVLKDEFRNPGWLLMAYYG